jgi:hypothetical protein
MKTIFKQKLSGNISVICSSSYKWYLYDSNPARANYFRYNTCMMDILPVPMSSFAASYVLIAINDSNRDMPSTHFTPVLCTSHKAY